MTPVKPVFSEKQDMSKSDQSNRIFVNEQDLFGITIVRFQTYLLVFGSPKGSPNTSKIRQNITRYLAEKCLITS